jgi:hypothetical protein
MTKLFLLLSAFLYAALPAAAQCTPVDPESLPPTVIYELPSWVTALSFTNPADVVYQPKQGETIAVSNRAMVPGYVGQTYCMWLAAGGGVPPYAFTAFGLPEGLVMASSGNMSGAPTEVGLFRVDFYVTDSQGTVASVDTRLLLVCEPGQYCSIGMNMPQLWPVGPANPVINRDL